MKVKSTVVLGALVVAAVATGPASTSAADPPFVAHFKGRGAQTILTDCELDDPNGTECIGVDVFATQDHYQVRGETFTGPFVNVIVYDVVIDSSQPDGFIATVVAEGSTTDAEVVISPNLSTASVTAGEVPLVHCVFDPQAPPVCTDAGTLSLEATWTATGTRQTETFHQRGSEGSFSYNFHAVDASRPASARGVVDGVALHDTPLFGSTIFSTNQGTLERFSG